MILGSCLLLLYSDQSEFHLKSDSIELRFALTDERWVELNELKQILENRSTTGLTAQTFPRLEKFEDLQKAAFALCEGLQKEKVYMISLSAFNSLIEHHEGIEQILAQIPSVSTSIQNVELLEKKKNIFSRFLGD
jgi:hypothetical protein